MSFPRALIALDVLANAFAFGRHVETLSKRAAEARAKGRRWGCVFCGMIDRVDKGHCDRALTDREQGY